MKFTAHVSASAILLAFATTASAQPGVVHVNHDTVNAALAKGGQLVERPQVRIAGVHREKPGAVDTQQSTTILYITDGEGTFVAGARTQSLSKGDVVVVPAGTSHSLTNIARPISYLQINVPVFAKNRWNKQPVIRCSNPTIGS